MYVNLEQHDLICSSGTLSGTRTFKVTLDWAQPVHNSATDSCASCSSIKLVPDVSPLRSDQSEGARYLSQLHRSMSTGTSGRVSVTLFPHEAGLKVSVTKSLYLWYLTLQQMLEQPRPDQSCRHQKKYHVGYV